jgi:phosphoenolpyruvate carboxylase
VPGVAGQDHDRSLRGALSSLDTLARRVVLRDLTPATATLIEEVRGLATAAGAGRAPGAEEVAQLQRALHELEPATAEVVAAALSTFAALAHVLERHSDAQGLGGDRARGGGRLERAVTRARERLGTARLGDFMRSGPLLAVEPCPGPLPRPPASAREAHEKIARLLAGRGLRGAFEGSGLAQLDRLVEELWRAERDALPRPAHLRATGVDAVEDQPGEPAVAAPLEEVLRGPVPELLSSLRSACEAAGVEVEPGAVGVRSRVDAKDLVARASAARKARAGLEEVLGALEAGGPPLGSVDVAVDDEAAGAALEELSRLRERHGGALGRYLFRLSSASLGPEAVVEAARAAIRAGVVGGEGMDLVPMAASGGAVGAAPGVMDALLSDDSYRRAVGARGDRQEIVLSRLAPNKEAGPITSAWELDRAASSLEEVASRHGVSLRVAREGRSSLAEPQGGACGCLLISARGTEGRVVPAGWGLEAASTGELMEEALAGALDSLASYGSPDDWASPQTKVPARWLKAMELVSRAAHDAYRSLVGHPGMPRYFRQSTPAAELAPGPGPPLARPGAEPSVEAVPAASWLLGWALCRQQVPLFYGAGAGLESARSAGLGAVLAEMHRGWPFFSALVGSVEAGLASADMRTASYYVERLVDPFIVSIFDKVVEERARSEREVLALTGSAALPSPPAARRMGVAAVCSEEPLHRLQVALLTRVRTDAPPDPSLRRALLRTAVAIGAA